MAAAPFGELAWDHARRMLARRGEDPATEAEIAHAVEALLDRAGQGPGSEGPAGKGRRVAGRTRAVAEAPRPGPLPPPEPGEETNEPGTGQEREPAKVIPLGIFDPFAEARKRW